MLQTLTGIEILTDIIIPVSVTKSLFVLDKYKYRVWDFLGKYKSNFVFYTKYKIIYFIDKYSNNKSQSQYSDSGIQELTSYFK